MGGVKVPSLMTAGLMGGMKAGELKRYLQAQGCDTKGCIERADLEALAREQGLVTLGEGEGEGEGEREGKRRRVDGGGGWGGEEGWVGVPMPFAFPPHRYEQGDQPWYHP